MEHCSEVELVEFSQGRLETARAEAVRAHLARCAKCAGLAAEMEKMTGVMDTWRPGPAEVLSASLSVSERAAVTHGCRFWTGFSRVAAVIVVAAMLGSGGGYYLAVSGYEYTKDHAPMTDQTAAGMLQIRSLEPGSATGFDVSWAGLLASVGGGTAVP
jgi:hypothetical protein